MQKKAELNTIESIVDKEKLDLLYKKTWNFLNFYS